MATATKTKRKPVEAPARPPDLLNPPSLADAAAKEEDGRLGYLRRAVAERPGLARLLTPKLSKYVPHSPHPKQAAFLLLSCLEAFYGGAGGGGKSDALLMAALQYVDVPGYSALLLRRSYSDLAMPEALMDRAHSWLGGTDAKWNDQIKTWTFPNGSKLTFGYLEHQKDVRKYQGAAFQFIGFDELTQFEERMYRFLFTRLRKPKDGPLSKVPLRMRSASNPGDRGHEWVKQRFLIEGPSKGRVFVPARVVDNPTLDAQSYEVSLNEVDPVTRAQMLLGDWTAKDRGKLFRRDWFRVLEKRPEGVFWVRYWDLAGTVPHDRNRDPDFTAGALVGERAGVIYLAHMIKMRGRPGEVMKVIRDTAMVDGREVKVIIQQDPGQAGVQQIENYQRMLGALGYSCEGDRVTGEKTLRWGAFSSSAQAGNVAVVAGPWVGDFFDELEAAPNGAHDDQVDAASGGHDKVSIDVEWTGDW